MPQRFLIAFLASAMLGGTGWPQQTTEPLTKNQVMDLVKFGMDNTELAKRIKEHGVDFEPADDYLESLRKAGASEVVIQTLRDLKPKPLTREQVGRLVAGGVPSERATTLVKEHGIDFAVDEEYLKTLRVAGADDALIAALREASEAVTAELVVITAPGAEVYLDGTLQGKASVRGGVGAGSSPAQGETTLKSKPGAHLLKVSLTGKKDFLQTVGLAAAQTTKVTAELKDPTGSIDIRTAWQYDIHCFLDGQYLQVAYQYSPQTGRCLLDDVPPGTHEVMVRAPRKKDYHQTVTVVVQKETKVEATLQDAPPEPGNRGGVVACGCYCGITLPAPCSQDDCRRACGLR